VRAHRFTSVPNRLLALIRWSISFVIRRRDVRLITSRANADGAARPAAHSETIDASNRDESVPVAPAKAGEAFRHPFRYAQ
jgi:hypothetical protein